jgi:hypothetical protein
VPKKVKDALQATEGGGACLSNASAEGYNHIYVKEISMMHTHKKLSSYQVRNSAAAMLKTPSCTQHARRIWDQRSPEQGNVAIAGATEEIRWNIYVERIAQPNALGSTMGLDLPFSQTNMA